MTKESIEELLKAEKLPAVIAFTDKNSQKIFSAGIEKQVGIEEHAVSVGSMPPLACNAKWAVYIQPVSTSGCLRTQGFAQLHLQVCAVSKLSHDLKLLRCASKLASI